MKYTIFPGCLISYRFPEYEKSAKLILQKLEVEFIPVDSFSCCGSQVLESIDDEKMVLLNARNLAIAQELDIGSIITLCGSCTHILKKSLIKLHDNKILKRINKKLRLIGLKFFPKKKIEIIHIAEFLNKKEIFQKFQNLVVKKLEINIAVQNPCMVLRPSSISNLELKNRKIIRNLLTSTGITASSYRYMNRCCGGTMLAFDDSIAKDLGKLRYKELQKSGANILAVGCPNCQLMYSIYQNMLVDDVVPSIFFTQLLGLSIGFSQKDMEIDKNINTEIISNILNNSIKNNG
ncbi:MAG: heterodisulfide reductase-related iron-sulfur binding cluster [Candidatus Helarchaeota archaeon]